MLAAAQERAAASDESDVRHLVARWSMDATAVASMKTPDYEMVDRSGHWIKSNGPEFNQRLCPDV